ncbi:MAG: anti-sigma factor family protein [Steroidobacteraceae bacterium]
MQKDTDFEFELHAYVDGDLDEDSMARVEESLRKDPEAAAKVRDYLKQKDTLRGFAREEASSDEAPAIHELGEKLAKRLRPGPWPGWRRATVMAMLLVVGWLGHVAYVPLAEGPGFANEVVQAHLLTSSDLSEVLPISRERVSKLFTRIGEIERLPDLRRFGFEPVGAQLLPSDEGVVLHIPYRDAAGKTVSYFLLHDRDEAELPRHFLHRNGVTMIYWQHDHSRHAVAAALQDDEISRIATFLDSPAGGDF